MEKPLDKGPGRDAARKMGAKDTRTAGVSQARLPLPAPVFAAMPGQVSPLADHAKERSGLSFSCLAAIDISTRGVKPMTLRELLKNWEKTSSAPLTEREYAIRLTLKDAARIAALAEMYPSRSPEQILTELVGAALNELEHRLPYIEGKNVTSLDELGDPIYEDVGPTSRFVELTRKHLGGNKAH